MRCPQGVAGRWLPRGLPLSLCAAGLGAMRGGWRVGPSAQAIVENEVRELVRRRGIDPIAEAPVVARLVDEVVADYRDRSITAALPPLGDVVATTRSVLDAVAGFGPLQPLLDDESVEEICIRARLWPRSAPVAAWPS